MADEGEGDFGLFCPARLNSSRELCHRDNFWALGRFAASSLIHRGVKPHAAVEPFVFTSAQCIGNSLERHAFSLQALSIGERGIVLRFEVVDAADTGDSAAIDAKAGDPGNS